MLRAGRSFEFKKSTRFSGLIITFRNGHLPYIVRETLGVSKTMAEESFGKILVAFDGSEDSVRATRLACSLAKKYGSKVTVVHVYSFAVFAYGGATPMPMPDVTPLEEAAKNKGASILRQAVALAKDEGVPAQGELIEASSIVQALVEYASKERFDLIVVGTRGMTGFKKLIMGSVSSGLASHAECPVLVVR